MTASDVGPLLLEKSICKENISDTSQWQAHQLLVYADTANLLGDNINTIKRTTDALIDASKEAYLETNAERMQCIAQCLQVTSAQRLAACPGIHDK
jgi:hypothetical protein